MADVPASGPVAVAYLVFSTLFGLLLGWRAECFRQVRRSARPRQGVHHRVLCPRSRPFRPWAGGTDPGGGRRRGDRRAILQRRGAAAVTIQIVTVDGDGMRMGPVAIRHSRPSGLGLRSVGPAVGSPRVQATGLGGRSTRPVAAISRSADWAGCVANSEGRSNSMAAIARMRTIVLDCPDPQMLARFYGELLGWEVTYADDDWVNLAGPGGKLSFQLAPDYMTPTWP